MNTTFLPKDVPPPSSIFLPKDVPPGICTINNKRIFELSLHDLTSTIYVNLFIFVVVMLFFEHMRHKNSVYFARRMAAG